ncbi:hypothetical protein L7F22_040734 [Adiantum nelumboides]|nr:hypothetical protein [Adiantum nelumboides]
MCQCLSFLAYPCPSISERWALWKLELQRLIARITSYNGPFTGLEVQRLSISGSVCTYSASGAKVQVTLTMGTCMSSPLSSVSATTKQEAPSSKRKPASHVQDPVFTAAAPGTPSKRAKDKLRKELRQLSDSHPSITTEVGVLKKICMNGSSNCACLFTQQGRKGINQDAMIVCEDFGSQEDAVFCGVFDGHGPHGHLVAQFVRNSLPSMLASSLKTNTNTFFEATRTETGCAEGEEKSVNNVDVSSSFQTLWKESFLDAYMLMDKELQGKEANVDCYCSGTTAVTLVKQGNDVILGNVGDSRAIIGTRADDGSLVAVQLTVDLKPNLPQEAERIRQCRGRVFALQDEPDVHRVWLPHDNSPGLAMARAFGDFCLKNFGVIAIPEVTHHRLTEQDQFIVLATDGVWDVLSNKEVVDIVAAVPSKSLAARAVVEMAVHAWRSKFPTSKIDDCAVVCLFIKGKVTTSPGKNIKKTILRKRTNSATFQKVGILMKERTQEGQAPPNIKSGGSNHLHLQSDDIIKMEPDNICEVKLEVDSTVLPSHTGVGTAEKNVKLESKCGADETGIAVMPFSVAESDEWSALDGVTRVNSLVNLPRFIPGDSRAGG